MPRAVFIELVDEVYDAVVTWCLSAAAPIFAVRGERLRAEFLAQ